MSENIIEFQDVSFRYEADESEKPLPLCVEHVNLNIKKGDFVAVLGHNGSGKSTLAKLSNSILIPESGRVLVNGMDTPDEMAEAFKIRIIRLSPRLWKRMSRSVLRIWASRPRSFAAVWTMR